MKDNWWEDSPLAEDSTSKSKDNWWEDSKLVSDEPDSFSKGTSRGIGELEQSAGGLAQATGNAASPMALSSLEVLSHPTDDNAPWYQKYITDPIKQNVAKVGLAASALPAYFLPSAGKDISEAGNIKIAKNASNNPSLAGQLGEMLPGAAAYIGTGLVTGGVAPMMGLAGLQTFGSKYGAQIDKGASPEDAAASAYPSTVLSAATAALPFEAFKMGKGLVGHATSGVIGAEAQNALNTIGELAISKMSDRPDLTWDQAKKEAYDQISSNAAATGIIGLGGGAVAHGVDRIVNGKPVKTEPNLTDKNGNTSNKFYNPTTGEIENVDGSPPDDGSGGGGTPIVPKVDATSQEIPSLATDIESGKINSDQVKQGKIDGSIDFRDGKWDYARTTSQQTMPTDAKSVVDAINSGGNVDSNTLRSMLKSGDITWNNGKLEAVKGSSLSKMPINSQSIIDAANSSGNIDSGAVRELLRNGKATWNNGKLEAIPITQEQENYKIKIASDIGQTLNQQSQFPLLEHSSTGVKNIDTAHDLRRQSLDNILAQMKGAESNKGKNIDDTNAIPKSQVDFTNAVNDYQTNHNLVESLKSQVPTEEQPIVIGKHSDTDTVKSALDAIANKDVSTLHTDVVHDMIDNNLVKINQDGFPEMTPHGQQLHEELSKLNAPDNTIQEPNKTVSVDDQNRVGTKENAQKEHPYKQFFDEGSKLPEEAPKELLTNKDNESLPVKEVAESTLPKILDQQKELITTHLNEGESIDSVIDEARSKLESVAQKTSREVSSNKNDILYDLRAARLQDKFKNPSKGLPALAHYLTLADSYKSARPDVFEGLKYSTTPNDKFIANKEKLKTQVTNIIRRINPSVDIKLMDKMFGEGESLKASGAKTADRQEVAGAYDRLKNLVYASLNTEKWNPHDTAYHEAFHSVFDMLRPNDQAILKKEFPGNENYSPEEHMAVEFAKFMTGKNATGILPSIRRIFSSIKQAIQAIGRTLKLGKFNSVEDVFHRIESGDVYNKYQEALKAGDIESLKNSELTPEQQEQAIKEVSPALHDIVYKAKEPSEEDKVNMRAINKENALNPIKKATSIGNDIYNSAAKTIDNGLNNFEAAKEKMLRSTVDLVKPIITDKAYNKAKDNIEHSISMTKRNSGSLNVNRTVKDAYGVLVASTDGFGRSIAAKFKSPSVTKIMDSFHAEPGKDRSIGSTYHEDIGNFYNKTMSRVAHMLDGVKSKSDKEDIRNYMTNPERMTAEATKSGNGRIASHLAYEIQEMRKHLASFGYEVPEVEGFYPRIYDTDFIVKNEANFKRDAKLAYLDTYKEDFAAMSPEDRDAALNEKVDSWFNNIMLQDNGITADPNQYFKSTSTAPSAPSSFKARTLSKAADHILADYMVRDPMSAMNKLTMQTARKAAWENHFGGTKLKDLHQGMISEGVDNLGIQHVMDIIRANTGQMGGNINPTIKNGLALARYWTAVNYLTKAPFKHLSISLNIGTQTGNMMNAWRTFADGLHAFAGSSDKARAMKTLGELAGVYGEAAEHSLMMNQAGMDTDNAKINWLSKQYFKAVGMTHLVGSFKLGMMRSIQYYLADMAEDIVNHSNSYKSAEFMVKNYGVPAAEVGNFSKWVMDGGGKNLQQSIMLDNSPHSKMYQLALQRAVNQMISNPTPATRQMYATHPVGSVIMQMTAYHMAYVKNSLERNARLAREGLNPNNGFSATDRMRMLTPMAMTIPVMWGFAAAYNAAKDAAFPPDKEDKNNHALSSFLDADFFGQFNGLMKDIAASHIAQKAFNYKYHTFDDNVLGADASLAENNWKMVKNFPDNWSSNPKAKSAQLKAEYNLLAAPMMTAALSKYNAFAIPTFAAIQAINHPSVRRAVVNAIK